MSIDREWHWTMVGGLGASAWHWYAREIGTNGKGGEECERLMVAPGTQDDLTEVLWVTSGGARTVIAFRSNTDHGSPVSVMQEARSYPWAVEIIEHAFDITEWL